MREKIVCRVCFYRHTCPMDVKPYTDECIAIQARGNKDMTTVTSEQDAVNHPTYYTQSGACNDAIEAAVSELSGMDAVNTAQIIRCMWGWKHRNGIEDLKKARWCLNKLIASEERKEQKPSED